MSKGIRSPDDALIGTINDHERRVTRLEGNPFLALPVPETAWLNLPLSAAWGVVTTPVAQYCKNANGQVRLRGCVSFTPAGSVWTVASTIGTLPAGYLPLSQQCFSAVGMCSAGVPMCAAWIDVTTGGLVRFRGATDTGTAVLGNQLWINQVLFYAAA